MKLKLCQKCKRPYLAKEDFCPHCPEPYTWNQESWMNVGCLLMMTVVPLFLLLLFWFFFFLGLFIR